MSYRVSHSRGWAEVSFAFVPGFMAKTQDPSSLAPQFEGFTVPALPNARNNRNSRLLCPLQAVRCYLDHTVAHRPHCERMFVTAGRSKKEILKTTVSFWLRKTISRAYQLSATEQPVPVPRARETRGIAQSLLFLACVFGPHPPWLLLLDGSQVSHTRSPSHLSINLLLIPKVSMLSEQMKFCFRTHFS